MPRISVLPDGPEFSVPAGIRLQDALHDQGIYPDMPCGGRGKCGKCTAQINGVLRPVCRTVVEGDLTVLLPEGTRQRQEQESTDAVPASPGQTGFALAFDLGSTTVVGYLLERSSGRTLAQASARNPQTAFGGDVVSRIQAALQGKMSELTRLTRECLAGLSQKLCQAAGREERELRRITLVGNSCMQQLFLGILPDNLARIPFAPVLRKTEIVPAGDYLPRWQGAELVIVPDIAGFVGADTVGGLLSVRLWEETEPALLVDIGTNGEMVLGNSRRMLSCATAAGPALEGAGICFGMRAEEGAIHRVWAQEGQLHCAVLGGGRARGLCGSGLVSAAAALLELGRLNPRGRLETGEQWNGQNAVSLQDGVYLTQGDLRELQLAKGAIAAGVRVLAQRWGIRLEQIARVYLAGAFGSVLDPGSLFRIGLLPPELSGKVQRIGNAAGRGARLLACDETALAQCNWLAQQTEYVELSSVPEFAGLFGRATRFQG